MKQDGALGTKVYSINQNHSWGQDMEGAIVANAAAGGYQVVEKALPDTNKIQDFAPYVNKIPASTAHTVLTGKRSHDLLLPMKGSTAAGVTARVGTAILHQQGTIATAGDVTLGHQFP